LAAFWPWAGFFDEAGFITAEEIKGEVALSHCLPPC
jgi:hypothetical protein